MDRRLQGRRELGQGLESGPQTVVRGGKAWLPFLLRGWPHGWILATMVVVGGGLYYLGVLFSFRQDNTFVHIDGYMNRVLLMVPVIYGGFILGPRAGFLTLAAITALMLPKDLLVAPHMPEALLETFAVVLVSSLVIVWFGGQQKEKERREEAVAKLETARQELAYHIDVITRREGQLSAIHEVCRVIASSLDLPFVLQQILERTAQVMVVPVALIFLKDKADEELQLVAHTGISEEFAHHVATVRIGEGFNGRVALSGEPMIVENALEDPRLSLPQVRQEDLRSQLIVPLRSKSLTIGTLCVAVRSSRRFFSEDVELLTALGSQVGIAIENARLYQEALTSQQKYRDLFENATIAIFVHDLNGMVTAANKACANLMEYSLPELIGMDMGRLFSSSAMKTLAEVERRLLGGEAVISPYEARVFKKDGTELVLSMTTRLIVENGQPGSLQHIALDITERRRLRDIMDDYMRRVLTAQEDERRRIARELHDETAQSLLLISQSLDALASDSRNSLSPETKSSLENTRGFVITTLTNLRRFTQDLRPRILDDLGLVAALEWLADDLEMQTSLRVGVEVSSPYRPLRPEAQLLLFRIAQEALSNVRRHAAASHVTIALECPDDRVKLTIRDNGRGFLVPARLADLASAGKLGILGMHERARLLNGTVVISSDLGHGTEVVAELPA